MDSTRSLIAAATATPVAGTAPARPQGEAANDTSAFFANLLQKVSSQFFTPNSLVDPTSVQTYVAPQDNRAPEPKNDASAPAKDDKVDDTSDKKNTAADDKTTDTKATTTDTAKNDSAATPAATDPAMSAQLSALQALLLTQQQTAAPVVETAAAVVVQAVAAPEAVAEVDPTATAVVDPNAPAATEVVAAPEAVAQTTTDTTPQEILAAQVQNTATVAQGPAVTKAADTTTKTAAKTTDVLSNQPQVTEDTDATPTTDTKQATLPQTAKAQAQSEAMTKLLGDTNAIRVAVTVDPKIAAATTTDVYDHFSGYSMGNNAGASNANGQFGADSAGNALTADADTSAPLPNVLTQASAAAAQAPTVATPTNTAAPIARTDVAATAVTSVSGSSASSEANGGLGQTGLGQPGPNNTNAANATNGTQQTNQPAATPAQVFEQIKVKITRATKAGLDEVTINLRPDELGRVDIKLQVTPEGKVHATVTADNQQTLNLLKNDALGLERTLNEAGLRADANNLEFNLRGDGNASSGSQFANGSGGQNTGAATTDEAADAPTYDYGRAAYRRGGVDTYA
jgi:flagellar hook-length control protein FliK